MRQVACESRLSFFDVFLCCVKKIVLLIYSKVMRVLWFITIQEMDDFLDI